MGGLGSGRRWFYGANETTGDYRAIDVRRWQRDKLLVPNQSFGWSWSQEGQSVASIQVHAERDRIFLVYRHRKHGGDWKDENYSVMLQWTLCNFGGKRPWFLCPVKSCVRRVAILYGGEILACRRCYQLAYPSQREPDYERSAMRAEKIRDRLGWEPGFLNGEGLRPKGMHGRTFERLKAEHDTLVSQSVAKMESRFGINL